MPPCMAHSYPNARQYHVYGILLIMIWDIEYTDEFEEWWFSLSERDQNRIRASIAVLEQLGPGLGRPLVDTIHRSHHANMKELRPPGSNIRILFAFDPRRIAILLIGGDKTNQWEVWYRAMIPVADQLYDDHLATLRREGELS
jgi:hypothetical protein